MSSKSFKAVRVAVLLLASLMVLEMPVAGQGNGRGRGRGRGRGNVVWVDPTPGVPSSPRGRGRNWHPRTPRGRIARAIIRSDNRNIYPGVARRRRIRRGYRLRHMRP